MSDFIPMATPANLAAATMNLPTMPDGFSGHPAAVPMDRPAAPPAPVPQVSPGTPAQPGPANPSPVPVPSPEQMYAELEYLKQHGEDVSSLQTELESLLGQRQAPPQAQPQPQQQQVQPQAPQPSAQETALDPYAPNMPGISNTPQDPTAVAEPEPGEVTIDAEGRVRDAKTGKYVPHQAMQAERVKRQKLESEIAEMREKHVRAEERLSMLTQIMEGQRQAVPQPQVVQPEPQPDIDPEVDIFGAFKQLKELYAKQAEQLEATKKQTTEHLGQMQLVDRYRQDVTRFSSETPDFFDAYKHLTNTRRAELKVLGFADERAIGNQMAIEERALAMKALNEGRSAAQVMYDLAKAKGYAGKAPAPQPQPQPQPQQQAQPQPAPVPQPAPQPMPPMPVVQPQPAMPQLQVNPAAAQRVQHLQNGVQNSATLSASGGSPGEGLTVQQLAEMSEADFMTLAGKLGMAKLDSLMRG